MRDGSKMELYNQSDKRPLIERPMPKNKFSQEEYKTVIKVTNLPMYSYLPPSQIVPIFSRKIVGWKVWEEELGELAAQLVERAVLKENTIGKLIVLHSDNGSPMKASTLKAKLETLGIMTSYSRPRVSNDNPYSEALFKTYKYRPNYPHEGFDSLELARKWVMKFVDWYNSEHYHSGLNFITPQTRHNGMALKIMNKRKMVYNSAKELHPERWSKDIRNWELPDYVALNPTDEIKKNLTMDSIADYKQSLNLLQC